MSRGKAVKLQEKANKLCAELSQARPAYVCHVHESVIPPPLRKTHWRVYESKNHGTQETLINLVYVTPTIIHCGCSLTGRRRYYVEEDEAHPLTVIVEWLEEQLMGYMI